MKAKEKQKKETVPLYKGTVTQSFVMGNKHYKIGDILTTEYKQTYDVLIQSKMIKQ